MMKTDNEKIAEFDGWIRNPEINKGSRIQWIHPQKSTWLTESLAIPSTPENMKYHTSWDWLMPVVEKIKQLRDFDTVTDGKHNRDPYFATRVADLLGILTTVDIKVVHLAVVAFIDWYSTSQTLKK